MSELTVQVEKISLVMSFLALELCFSWNLGVTMFKGGWSLHFFLKNRKLYRIKEWVTIFQDIMVVLQTAIDSFKFESTLVVLKGKDERRTGHHHALIFDGLFVGKNKTIHCAIALHSANPVSHHHLQG